MRLQILSTLLFSCLILNGLVQSQKMQDFTYADILLPQKQTQQNEIHISPSRQIFDSFQFPNACQVDKVFSTKQQSERPLPQLSDIDGQINFLKDRMSQFLRLADKVELLTKNIKNLPQLKYNANLHVKQQQLQVIQQQETKLKQINFNITKKTLQLQNIVNEMMLQKQNHLFKQASLSFQKKALIQKITLFNNLIGQAKIKQEQVTRQANKQHLNNYFRSLQNIFDTENNLISTIDTLLKNHNELAQLKSKITSLSSQIKAYDLTINQKQQCNSQYLKIQEKQKYDKDLIRMIQLLKIRKSQFSPNKYCQGVVQKLIQRIRRLLLGYDYIWKCKQGLEQLRKQRDLLDKQLKDAQRKQGQLQMSKGANAFRRQFQHNRALVQNKVDQINGLKLDDYYNDPNKLSKIVQKSQQKIAQLDRQISQIPIKSNNQLTTLQNLIQQKIDDIKRLKGYYCNQNQGYVINYNIIKDRLYKFEQQEVHNEWISNVQQETLQQIQSIKKRMSEIQKEVRQFMSNNSPN